MIALPFVALILTLLLGIPIAFALAGAGIFGIYLVKGDWNIVLVVFPLRALPG